MAETGTLHDAFIDELRDTYDAEKQLTKALPKLAKAASSPELRQAFESHLEETEGQIRAAGTGLRQPRREGARQALRRHRRHHRGRQVGHGRRLRRRDDGRLPDRRRASAPNTTRWRPTARWSRGREAMGHDEAADLLQETLDEEKAADEKLSALAEGGINQGAADVAHPDENEDEAEAVGATAGRSAKSNKTTKSSKRG